jgi:hypothetical protein
MWSEGLSSNYDFTKVCFAYFYFSLEVNLDEKKARVPLYPNPAEPGKPKLVDQIRAASTSEKHFTV